MGKKLETIKSLFEIGKLAAETYSTYTDAHFLRHFFNCALIEKDKELARLQSENEKLKKKLKEKGIDID